MIETISRFLVVAVVTWSTILSLGAILEWRLEQIAQHCQEGC